MKDIFRKISTAVNQIVNRASKVYLVQETYNLFYNNNVNPLGAIEMILLLEGWSKNLLKRFASHYF